MPKRCLISVLAILILAASAGAQTLALDKCLDDLAKNQALGPVVAVMRGPVEGTADLSSLQGLARTFGLELFEQDGIRVLGPAEVLRLYDVSPFVPKEPPKPTRQARDEFLRSLTDEQMKAIGSSRGLHFADLTADQQALLRRMFSTRAALMIPAGEVPVDENSVTTTYNEVYLQGVPPDGLTITGEITYLHTLLSDGEGRYDCGLATEQPPPDDSSELRLQVEPEPETDAGELPRPSGPNELKESHLDYDRPELRKDAAFERRTTLRDVVAAAARESGLPLLAGPGSEQVGLYIGAPSETIGQVLKAVSRATGGTWRKVGGSYLFALDVIGLGSFDQMLRDYYDFVGPQSDAGRPFDADLAARILIGLPVAPGTGFSLNAQQIGGIVGRLAMNPAEADSSVSWEALTEEQKSVVLKACEDPERPSWVPQSIEPLVSARLVFHFPAVGNASVGPSPARYEWEWSPLEPDAPWIPPEFQARSWPKGSKIPMPAGIRGIVREVSKSDTPAGVAAEASGHGLDTLLIRVFADGYAIFPSRQFPPLPGMKADDFLRNTIAAAHAKGVRVVGVIDVLRWSDGSKNHWLYKAPELLDREIAGRSNTEWQAQRPAYSTVRIEERMAYGDAFDGDFVSPFQPVVREKLSALVEELADYDLDGIAFDHAAVVVEDPYEDEVLLVRPGQMGFNDAARAAFAQGVLVDPADMVGPNFGLGTTDFQTPLRPLMAGAGGFLETWEQFYRTACYTLTGDLAAVFRKVKPGLPVWWLDTYLDGDPGAAALTGADRVVRWADRSAVHYPGAGIDLVRITDALDLLYAASCMAALQRASFPGMLGLDEIGPPPEEPIGDIILDFACSEARKREFLKLLEIPRPSKTR